MAKQIRAARHYQQRSDPLRRLADRAIPGVKSGVLDALKGLSELVPEAANRHAAAGDWNAVKNAVAWQHFRGVLRGAFGQIGKARESGARLGERHINAAFAQAGRPVRFRKYSPDQPRDERGRWVAVGGGRPLPGGVRAGRALDKSAKPEFSIDGKLTRDQLEGVRSWKGTYGWVNNYLRGKDNGETPDFIKERVSNLRDAIARASTTKAGVVYRGIGGSYKFGGDVGDKITMAGIIATSTEEDYSKLGKRWIDNRGTLFRIYLPKGSNALEYAQSQTKAHGGTYDDYDDDEREVILDHGSTFYVRSVRRGKRLTTVDLVYRRGG